MYKHIFAIRTLFIIILVLFLFACTTQPIAQLPTPELTASQFHPETALPTETLLSAASPNLTPQLTITTHLTATFTTITATFDASNIKTRTPAPPAQCPVEKPKLTPVFEYSSFTSESVDHFSKQVLDFLNAGGTRHAVVVAYRKHNSGARGDSIVQEKDITGDGVPDLLLTDNNTMDAFLCQNGQYAIKNLIGETYHFTQPRIIDIKDMNLDGVDEIIAIDGDDRFRVVSVLEWDGGDFKILNRDSASIAAQPCSELLGPSSAYAQDTDNNGTLKLILKQAIPIWSEYSMGLPWRKETRTCTWNGKEFTLTQTKIDTPPEYRFQAAQDGDRATSAGEYDRALSLYQQVVLSNTLKGWSQDRRIYEMEKYDEQLFSLSPVTPQPTPIPDPAEYANLAAYASFRILLLHVARGNLAQAEIANHTLQTEYPEGKAGHAYAEMAAVFWNTYQEEKNIEQACAKVIDYAMVHPTETLSYLGNGEYAITYYGDQSLEYKPEDLCPFR